MTHSEPAPSATDRLARQRLYRRLMVGFVGGGVAIALVLRDVLGYPLLSEAVYWVAIFGFLAVWRLSPVRLFDERDRALERRASQLTLTVFAVVLIVGASAGRVLPRIGAYDVPSVVWPTLYAYASVFVVFGVVYVFLRYRP